MNESDLNATFFYEKDARPTWSTAITHLHRVNGSIAARGGNLAKIPPNQVIADFGRGSSVESESE